MMSTHWYGSDRLLGSKISGFPEVNRPITKSSPKISGKARDFGTRTHRRRSHQGTLQIIIHEVPRTTAPNYVVERSVHILVVVTGVLLLLLLVVLNVTPG